MTAEVDANDVSDVARRVMSHYGRPNLMADVLAALRFAGKDPARLSPDDLSPLDEFHVRGREATLELARAAGIDGTMSVLDAGSGIGGPSRRLAQELGCRVQGIDLSDDYVAVATFLAARVGLSHLARYRQGDVQALPFRDGSFDVVWTQHVGMNVANKPAFYRELHRVAKPGGVLALYDVLAGTGGPVVFPVPWARDPETSFLASQAELRAILAASGFIVERWRDTSLEGRAWFARLAAALERGELAALGLHVLLGPIFTTMARNLGRNLEDGRVAVVEVVGRRA